MVGTLKLVKNRNFTSILYDVKYKSLFFKKQNNPAVKLSQTDSSVPEDVIYPQFHS